MWTMAWHSNWIIAFSNITKTHVKVSMICMTIEIHSSPNNHTEYNNMVKIILGHVVWVRTKWSGPKQISKHSQLEFNLKKIIQLHS